MEVAFLEHLELIEQVAEHAGRRAGFPRQDVEDFVSTVEVKLIDGDNAVLRKHRGESSLPTYLTTVVHNLFKDFCDHKLGKSERRRRDWPRCSRNWQMPRASSGCLPPMGTCASSSRVSSPALSWLRRRRALVGESPGHTLQPTALVMSAGSSPQATSKPV